LRRKFYGGLESKRVGDVMNEAQACVKKRRKFQFLNKRLIEFFCLGNTYAGGFSHISKPEYVGDIVVMRLESHLSKTELRAVSSLRACSTAMVFSAII
jgi:hypothetical protein